MHPTVDIHCHVMTADDLPVRGFLVHGHGISPGLARLVDDVLQKLSHGEEEAIVADLGDEPSQVALGALIDAAAREDPGGRAAPGITLKGGAGSTVKAASVTVIESTERAAIPWLARTTVVSTLSPRAVRGKLMSRRSMSRSGPAIGP